MSHYRQPWIYSKWVDGLFIIAPPFVVLLLIVFFPDLFLGHNYVTPTAWIILVLGIDVSHVYSTLFRTYFDVAARNKYRNAFLFVPVGCLIAGVLLHSIDHMLFWRCLAYLAVFHFIRQQYGFMRLYSRKENNAIWKRRMDAIMVYTTMLYPIVYWHFSGDRNFTWFVEGDFLLSNKKEMILNVSLILYFIIAFVFLITEIRAIIQHKVINIPKLSIISGTALSWYFGIVYFNGDLTFTALNVVAHGIPYMALVWIYGNKQSSKNQDKPFWSRLIFKPAAAILYLLPLLLLAFLEEGIWDAMVWQDHRQLFNGFYALPVLHDKTLLSVMVPLLSLPQVTHYVLDGFIWKVSRPDVKAEMGI